MRTIRRKPRAVPSYYGSSDEARAGAAAASTRSAPVRGGAADLHSSRLVFRSGQAHRAGCHQTRPSAAIARMVYQVRSELPQLEAVARAPDENRWMVSIAVLTTSPTAKITR